MAWALRLSSSRILAPARETGSQLRQIVERIALAHPRRPSFVDRRLEPPQSLLPLLVAADEVADIVAGAAVAPLGDALLRPALELVRDRDVHLCHAGLIRFCANSANGIGRDERATPRSIMIPARQHLERLRLPLSGHPIN